MFPNNQMPNYAGAYQPTVMVKPSNNRHVLKLVLGIFAAVVAALLGGLVLLLIAAETGLAALLAAMIVGTLPVPFYIMFILWIDRYESEPAWMLAAAFFWGATVAVFAAYFLNTLGGIVVAVLTRSMAIAQLYGAVISAPIVEESFKAIILFIFFFWKKDEFDGVIDGFVYAGMVGLGFAMTENFQYYGKVISGGGLASEDFSQIFVLRGLLAPYSHPLFTSMTGIGLGVARQSKSMAVKIIMPLLGLGLAMFLHFLWNFSALLSRSLEGFLQVYIILMVPIFIITVVVILFALLREGRVVREHLLCDFQSGMFTQEEYNRLCTIRGRMGASMRALTRGGFGVWRTRMQFNQAASELAFHRSRAARGLYDNQQTVAEREAAYLQMLQELRQRLGQH